MSKPLTLKFDPNQDFQIEAVQAVVDVFDGLPRSTSEYTLGDDIVANLAPHERLSEHGLADNVAMVQSRNGIERRDIWGDLEMDEGLVLPDVGSESWRYPSFTIEMETGTGKTYVYLRTINELRKRYGFRKFVIVVPSIAIYEGVVKNFEITQGHMRAHYDNEPVHLICYDGARPNKLKFFATSSFVEILVITLASFNSRKNVIYRPSEQLPGERLPYQYVQETSPILILDEPQNMGSDLARQALRTLHPVFALRYSATHRETPNLIYRLSPFDAYRRNLVKKIQVDAVTERADFNRPLLYLTAIERKGRISATVRTLVNDDGRTREESVVLRQGDDLYAKTMREEHVGLRIAEIHAGDGYVEFENGDRLDLADAARPMRDEVFRVQIERTVQEHMARQQRLLARGIKVLSLIFIDRVANYTADDGVIRRIFDETFDRMKADYPHFARMEAHQAREAYFATRKVKGADLAEAIDTPVDEARKKVEDREAEKAAYRLIMRKKEQLLSLEEPVSFVFAHSALREGWDNPNVFQICTLNQTVSEMRKRQEIGRGLRLAVDQSGERVFDESVNVLTVVANESYEDYVSRLQSEYAEDGLDAPPRPTRVGRTTARRNDSLFQEDAFRAFWTAVSRPTRYVIRVDTEALVRECLERLNNSDTSGLKPVIVVERGTYKVTRITLELESVGPGTARIAVRFAATDGEDSSYRRAFHVRDDLAKVLREPRLKSYQIAAVTEQGPRPSVIFENGQQLFAGEEISFDVADTRATLERTQLAAAVSYPVFNILDRAARETGLTRHTVNSILRGLSLTKSAMIPRNPEGFAGWFIAGVRNALADHVVEHMEFEVATADSRLDLDTLFPPTKEFPQKEIIEAGSRSLYDQVQVDSDVETRFVRFRLKEDDRILCYFKFPPLFKIQLPKVVGNYNPDWGILRLADDGHVLLRLVRETKGTTDTAQLQWAHEKRKISAATRCFRELGVDYRVVTDDTTDWWLPAEEQRSLGFGTGDPGSP